MNTRDWPSYILCRPAKDRNSTTLSIRSSPPEPFKRNLKNILLQIILPRLTASRPHSNWPSLPVRLSCPTTCALGPVSSQTQRTQRKHLALRKNSRKHLACVALLALRCVACVARLAENSLLQAHACTGLGRKRKWLEVGLLVSEDAGGGGSRPRARRVDGRQRGGVGQLFDLDDVERRSAAAAAVALDQTSALTGRRRRRSSCRCRLVADVVLRRSLSAHATSHNL